MSTPAFTPAVLGEGQLSASPSTIFLVPAGEVCYVHFVNFCNVAATAETVELWFKRSAAARKLGQSVLEDAGWRWEFLSRPLQLQAGDRLLASSTHAAAVDYVVTGIKQALS